MGHFWNNVSHQSATLGAKDQVESNVPVLELVIAHGLGVPRLSAELPAGPSFMCRRTRACDRDPSEVDGFLVHYCTCRSCFAVANGSHSAQLPCPREREAKAWRFDKPHLWQTRQSSAVPACQKMACHRSAGHETSAILCDTSRAQEAKRYELTTLKHLAGCCPN